MNFEVIKRSHIKRNILISVVVVLVLSAIILTFTRENIELPKVCHYLMGQLIIL